MEFTQAKFDELVAENAALKKQKTDLLSSLTVVSEKSLELVAENAALKCHNQELRGHLMLSNDRLDALWKNTGSLGCKSQFEDNSIMLKKTPVQCLNLIKANAVNQFISNLCTFNNDGVLVVDFSVLHSHARGDNEEST